MRDRQQRQHARLDEGADDGAAGLEDRDRPFGRVGVDLEHRAGEGAHRLVVVGIVLGRDGNASARPSGATIR